METKLPAADPSPYPPIQVQTANPVCAKAMLENLGGASSEMSAVAQYIYSSTVLSSTFPKAAAYFRQIAVVEMHHISIFAQLTQLLGGDPRLWSYEGGRPVYWTPSVLAYSRDPSVLLNRALSEENKTITTYRRMAGELPDPYIKAVLERLILDEEKHVTIFCRLLQEKRPASPQRPRKAR